jgi:ribonuclease-3
MGTENIKLELMELEASIGHQFKNIALLEEAITTSSYSTEHPDSSDYQSLEFLGDRVISLILAEKLLDVSESLDEGKMSLKIISDWLTTGKKLVSGFTSKPVRRKKV